MLKWLILGISVALVVHWSSKEVHADSPLTDEEQDLLLSLRSALNDNDKRQGSDECDCDQLDVNDEECVLYCLENDNRQGSDECDCDQLDDDDEDCFVYCLEEQMGARMIKASDEQEENLSRTLGSNSRPSKKWLVGRIRFPPIRVPRIRVPPIPRIRIPPFPRIPPVRRWWGKK